MDREKFLKKSNFPVRESYKTKLHVCVQLVIIQTLKLNLAVGALYNNVVFDFKNRICQFFTPFTLCTLPCDFFII